MSRANRLAGLTIAAFGAALWLWIIPWQVDAADYGWLRPRTLPLICAAALGLLGLILAAFPVGRIDLAPRRSLRVTGLLALSGLAVSAMGRWGFLWTSPVYALIVVIVLRERRWPWIVAAVVLVPAFIWTTVHLLGRPLP